MAFDIKNITQPSWLRIAAGGFPSVHALAFAPNEREAMLNSGVWLIVAVPIWSGPCRRAIDDVTNFAAQLPPGVNVGVRFFDEYEEIAKWLPAAERSYSTPQWFLLKDGKLIKERFGPLRIEQIRPFIEEPPMESCTRRLRLRFLRGFRRLRQRRGSSVG